VTGNYRKYAKSPASARQGAETVIKRRFADGIRKEVVDSCC